MPRGELVCAEGFSIKKLERNHSNTAIPFRKDNVLLSFPSNHSILKWKPIVNNHFNVSECSVDDVVVGIITIILKHSL